MLFYDSHWTCLDHKIPLIMLSWQKAIIFTSNTCDHFWLSRLLIKHMFFSRDLLLYVFLRHLTVCCFVFTLIYCILDTFFIINIDVYQNSAPIITEVIITMVSKIIRSRVLLMDVPAASNGIKKMRIFFFSYISRKITKV